MTDEKNTFQDEFVTIATMEGVEAEYAESYYNLLFELGTGLASRAIDGLLVVAISGAQGTGKSTFAKMLAIVLERIFEKATLVLSMDDFYLTRSERLKLAETVHPLLATRGVPGTHDADLMLRSIESLKAGFSVQLPEFSKGEDDRIGMIPVIGASLDILIVEGWCWGATPADEMSLGTPVNDLERERDPDGDWRWYVNDQLAQGLYQELFSQADATFYLAAPDFDTVFEWRWQQEQRLHERGGGSRAMSREEVREFVMHYERITMRMLEEMPDRADLTIFLDERHRVQAPRRDRFR